MADPSRPVTGYPAPNPQHPNGYNPNPPPPGTGYPYAAPPPPSSAYYYQSNYPYSDPDSLRRATCLRRIFAFIIGLVIIFGTITFIVWLVLRPEIPEFRVDSLSLSNFSIGNSSLISFTSELKLTSRNPNKKMSLKYDHIEAGLYYRSQSLAATTLPPFSQETKTDSSLTANFAAAGSFVDRSVVDGINGDRSRNGNVNFNFRLVSMVKFEAKAWVTRSRYLRVFCGNLIVGLPSNGTSGVLTGNPKQCDVGI